MAKKSNRYSWLKANLNHKALGAGLVHANSQYEGLPPVNPLDPDSPAGAPPDIRYWYHDGGEKSVSQPVRDDAGPFGQLKRVITSVWSTEAAYAESPDVIVGNNTTFRVRAQLPPLAEIPAVRVGNSERAIDDDAAGRLLGGKPERRQNQLGPDVTTRFGPKGLVIDWRSGAQRLVFSRESRVSIGTGEQAAIAKAKRFAADLGALPSDAEIEGVNKIASARIDLEDGSLGEEAVSEYVVDFGHSFEGVEIDGVSGDKVSVVVDADGVAEIHRSWRPIQGKESGLRARLTAHDALRVLADSGERLLDMPEEVDVTNVELVYYSAGPAQSQKVMFPAWRITLRGSEHFFVNAVTGRPMNE